MLIKAFATGEGLNLIEEDVKNHIKKFIVVGYTQPNNIELDTMLDDVATTYERLSPFIIYENSIHSAYYDDNGFLTFELEIDYASDLQKYIYGIAVISEIMDAGESLPIIISLSKSGRIFKSAGIGGLYVYKINVTGSPAEIIYQNNDYINLETALMLDNDTLNNAKEYTDTGDSKVLADGKKYTNDELDTVDNLINSHVTNRSNPHGVTKAQVGLGNADNTADREKFVKVASYLAEQGDKWGGWYKLILGDGGDLNRNHLYAITATGIKVDDVFVKAADRSNSISSSSCFFSDYVSQSVTLPAGGAWAVFATVKSPTGNLYWAGVPGVSIKFRPGGDILNSWGDMLLGVFAFRVA